VKTPELIALANAGSLRYDLPHELVMAVIEQESGWNEYAIRYEPGFMSTYVAPHFIKGEFHATEAYCRAMSWGLMQVLGQTARELGFKGDFLSELCSPINGIEYGCMKLAACMKKHSGNQHDSLLAYNGGGNANYPVEVIAKMDAYV
jgi:soluble lytic murein transglycosylase-like protein